MPLQPQRINIPIAGGLQGDEAPEYLDPPALYDSFNLYHLFKNKLTKRNGYFEQSIRVDPGTDPGDDSTTPNVPAVAFPQSSPFPTGIGIDRFINAGTSVLFAGGGHLWTYAPELFAQSTTSPPPNTVRGPEIPDVEVNESLLLGITDATPFVDTTKSYTDEFDVAAGAVNSDGQVVISYVRKPGNPPGFGNTVEWHVAIRDPNNSAINSDVVASKSTTQWLNPTVAWHSRGAVAMAFDYNHSDLWMQRFSFETMRWESSNVAFQGTGNVLYYDMVIQDHGAGFIAIAWIDTSGHLWVNLWDAVNNTNEWITGLSIDTGYTGGPSIPGLCLAVDPVSGNVAVAYSDATQCKVVVFRASDGLGVNSGVTVAYPSSALSLCRVTPFGTSAIKWIFAWRIQNADNSLSDQRSILQSIGLNESIVAVGYPKQYPGATFVSGLFDICGSAYAILRLDLPTPLRGGPTFFDEPLILARMHHELYQNDREGARLALPMAAWNYGAGVSQLTRVQSVWEGSNVSRKASGVITGAILDKAYGDRLLLEQFDAGSLDRYDSVPLPQNGAVFGCGNPWTWDGVNAFETSFIHRPIISKLDIETGDPLDPPPDLRHYVPGTYSFRAVYIHEDTAGRTTFSPPSDTVTISIPTDGTETVYPGDFYGMRTLTVSGLFFTARRPGTVTLALYISTDGIHFAQMLSVDNSTWNINAATPVKAKDIVIPLPEITFPLPEFSSPTIYTEDGTLASGYPRLASHLARWNNRIWHANGHQISHSREFTEGDAPAFPDDFSEFLDRDVTALSPLDDRMLLFAQDAVLYRSGEGPADNGLNSSYSSWNFITHEIGCNNGRSVVHTLIGVFFQSRRGIEWLKNDSSLTHVLEVANYFNAGTDPNTTDTILGVVSLPKDHQLRIVYNTPGYPFLKMLWLDYWTNTWTAMGGLQNFDTDVAGLAGDITVVKDQVYLASPSGLLLNETGNLYDTVENVGGDGSITVLSRHINWRALSPWIKGEGLQGFSRIWWSTIMSKCAGWASVFSIVRSGQHTPAAVVSAVVTGIPVPVAGNVKFKVTDPGDPISFRPPSVAISLDGGTVYGAPVVMAPAIAPSSTTVTVPGGTVKLTYTSGTPNTNEIITVQFQQPLFGIRVAESTDYRSGVIFDHGLKSIIDLQSILTSGGIVYLRMHHKNQAVRAFQVVMASTDTQTWPPGTDVTGVYELDGLMCEYGIEPGTGRLPATGKI